LRFFLCRFLSECAAGLFLLLAAVPHPSNLDFSIFKNFRLEEKKNGIQQRTGEQEMAYLERSRGKNIAGAWSS
jgi:hypothetical protein